MFSKRLMFLLIFLFVSSSKVFAQNDLELSHQFLQHALTSYENNQVEESLSYFCRAFLLDPQNSTAQDHLVMLSNHSGLSSLTRIELTLLKDLIVQTKSIESRINYYEHKKNVMSAELLSKGINGDLMQKKLQTIKQEYQDSMEEKSQNFDPNLSSKGALEILLVFMKNKKDVLSLNLQNSKNQFNHLRVMAKALNNKMERHMRPSEKFNNNMTSYSRSFYQKIEKNVYAKIIQPEADDTSFDSEKAQEEINELKKEFLGLHDKFVKYQELLKSKDEKLSALSQKVVELSLSLSERDRLFEKNSTEITSLNQGIDDLHSRLELTEKIIQEKSQAAEMLQIKLKETQDKLASEMENFDNQLISKDKKIVAMNGILQIYKGKLLKSNEIVQQKDADIKTLEDQLAMIQKNLLQQNNLLKTTKRELESMEVRLFKSEERLLRYKAQSNIAPQNPSASFNNINHLRSELDSIRDFLNKQIMHDKQIDDVFLTK